MKLKSMYDILGLKFQDKFFDVVICENPNLAYRDAKEILKNDGTGADCKDSDLTIITADRNNIYTVLRFVGTKNLENLRGCTIRKCYLDKEMSSYEEVKKQVMNTIGPNIKFIVEKD